jgi:hypothetical protein
MNATDMVALDLLDVHGPMGAAEWAHRLGIRSLSDDEQRVVSTFLDRITAAITS